MTTARLRTWLFLFSLTLLASPLLAQVRLARLFSDHVVLQRQQPIPVWGWAKPGETVRVVLAGQSQQAKADAAGRWAVRFAALEAGGPHQLTVTAKSGQATIHDVLVGEVWLCSGQSNMEWMVKQADRFPAEQRNANFPQIRHFRVEHELALTPQTDLSAGTWTVCSPETVGDFTAVGFFFARELAQKLNVPIGLLHASWGGSQAEGWISRDALLTNAELRPVAVQPPTTWAQVDSLVDYKLRKRLLGSGARRPTATDEATYLTADFDPAGWPAADPIGQWDWKGMNGFRGQGYMGRSVTIPADMVARPTTLALGENDSPNQIYVNGKLVSEGVLPGVRKLSLPAGTWQPGTNRLMVYFGNSAKLPWYGLGIRGSASDLYVTDETEIISLADNWRLMPSFAQPHTYTRFVNNLATGLYNAMIQPLIPFAMRGVLWYQGESNAGRAYQYRQTFPLLITDWRQRWGASGRSADFPFYFVQLASYGANQNSNVGSDWAELREAQTMTLRLPNTGMAVTTDVGNPKDIHPTNKQDVGHRLALVALNQTYGYTDAKGSPLFDRVAFGGNKVVLTFRYSTGGPVTSLVAKDKYGYVRGFELAGDDGVFYHAQAELRGNEVLVAHPAVAKPAAVRYGWADAPEDANLFSAEGLPVSPFRTDDWPGKTQPVKFD